MASQQSTVFEDITLLDFVQHVLVKHEGPSHLIFCGTKEDFLYRLKEAADHSGIESDPQHDNMVVDEASNSSHLAKASSNQHLWSVPTLRSLAMSRTVNVVFCPDITHLRAYLATYALRSADGATPDVGVGGKRILAILNLVQLHRPTSAFSAQGLNRTISVAMEAAHHASCQLLIAECSGPITAVPEVDDAAEHALDVEASEHPVSQALWDEEISILNVTTKSFGVGERGWVGRTVKLRTIAQRWCTFEKLPPTGDVS